jgi:hypothetical protein
VRLSGAIRHFDRLERHQRLTFGVVTQIEHRTKFIKKYRQKAWAAACNADYVG